MSPRTALRLVLVALLVVTLVGPAAAQIAVAPMPRAKPTREIRLGLSVGGPQVIQVQYEYRRLDMPAVAPMPRVVPESPRDDFEIFVEQIVPGRPADFPAYKAALPAPPCCAFDRCTPSPQQMTQQLSGVQLTNLTWNYNPPMPRAIVEVIGDENPTYTPGTTRCGEQLSIIPAYPHGVYLATCDQPSPITGCKPAGDIVVHEVRNCESQPRTMTLSQTVPLPPAIVEVIGDIEFGYSLTADCATIAPRAYFRPAPAMVPARPLPAPVQPLTGVTTVRWDESSNGWWVETVRMPQPKNVTIFSGGNCVNPVVIEAIPEPLKPRVYRPAMEPVQAVTHPVILRAIAAQPVVPSLQKCSGETWYREIDGVTISATFTSSEMAVRLVQCFENLTISFTITADCAVTKEGVVHGVVTGVDADVKVDMRTRETRLPGLEVTEAATELQKKLIDAPFCFRVKQTSSGMMVSSFRIGCEDFNSFELALACGMYKLAPDGRVPVAKPMAATPGGMTKCETGHCDAPASTPPIMPASSTTPQPPPLMPMPTPPGAVVPVREMSDQLRKVLGLESRYLKHSHEYFPPDHYHPLPREITATEDPGGAARGGAALQTTCPPTLNPPKPTNVPANEFGMMAEVFGQMMGQPNGQCQAPPVSTYTVQLAGMTHPTPMAMPMPMTVPPSVPVNPMMGTWYREVGPRMCVVMIDRDHLTLSFTEAEEVENGKTAAAGVTVTCDYHLSRDGVTAVGLITSVDAQVEGDLPDDSVKDLLGFVAAFQKACEEKPFALTLRHYGDSLVVGNVRMPDLGEEAEIQPSSMFGGRFKNAGNKPVPKAKLMKEPMHGTQRLPITTYRNGVAVPSSTGTGPMPTATSGSTASGPSQR